MEPEILRQYVEASSAVVIYAIDAHHSSQTDTARGRKARRNNGLALTAATFFEKLYVTREVAEARIYTRLHDLARPLVVVGPRGCGKTTTVHRVLSRLRSEGWAVAAVDITEQYERRKLNELDATRVRSALRSTLVDELRVRFFSSQQSQWRLWTFLFSSAVEQSCEFLPPGSELQVACAEASRIYGSMLTSVGAPFATWLESQDARRNGFLRDVIDKRVLPNLTVEALITACRKLLGVGPLILFVDNVDKFRDRAHQAACFNLVEDLAQLLDSETRFVTCVREENITRALDDANMPREDEIEAPHRRAYTVPCVNMPEFEPKLLDMILVKRFKLARELASLVDGAGAEELDDIEQAMRNEYLQERLIELANDNARDALYAHVRLLGFLEEVAAQGRISLAELTAYDYETLFYSWLVRDGAEANLIIYDIVEDLNQWLRSPAEHKGCMLSHLVLVSLLKKQEEFESRTGSRFGYATAGQVVDALRVLGWTRADVVDALRHLYSQGGDVGHMVELKTPLDGGNGEDFDPMARICITKRGKALCKAVTNRLTYFVECLLKHERAGQMVPGMEMQDVLRKDLEGLCNVAEMHNAGLQRIKTNLEQSHGAEWLTLYIERYTLEGKLQLDRMLESHVRHCERVSRGDEALAKRWLSGYRALQVAYTASVKALDAGAPVPPGRFRECVDFSQYRRR